MNSLFPHIDKIEHLRSVDGRMAQLVERFGYIERPTDRPLFEALVDSIVGQQVATPLAERTMAQLRKAVGGEEIVPQTIARLGIDGLAECGISSRKAEWLVSGAARFEGGEFEVEELQQLSDEGAIARLMELDGVGRWTAEMLLIFSLGRDNVLSSGDLIIRRALSTLYGIKKLTTKHFARFKRLFGPYSSVASFYLWAYGNTLPRKQGEVIIRSLSWQGLRDKRIAYSWHNTRYGRIIIASTAKGVCRVAFVDDPEEALDELRAEFRRCKLEEHTEDCHKAVLKAINGHLVGDMVLYLQGTPFERKVWREVVKVPSGIRVSYADIAARTGYTKAFRAVGNAVGANPVAILIPCHRVIHADGSLGDYNAGADKKQELLQNERNR